MHNFQTNKEDHTLKSRHRQDSRVNSLSWLGRLLFLVPRGCLWQYTYFFHSRTSKLEALLSPELVDLRPRGMFRVSILIANTHPAIAVHKSALCSFSRRHIASMSNITNMFTRVGRDSVGTSYRPTTPSLHSMRTSIVMTLPGYLTPAVPLDCTWYPVLEPTYYKVKAAKSRSPLT
jgi:hypothetical protein